jgi:hypothetical protein
MSIRSSDRSTGSARTTQDAAAHKIPCRSESSELESYMSAPLTVQCEDMRYERESPTLTNLATIRTALCFDWCGQTSSSLESLQPAGPLILSGARCLPVRFVMVTSGVFDV